MIFDNCAENGTIAFVETPRGHIRSNARENECNLRPKRSPFMTKGGSK